MNMVDFGYPFAAVLIVMIVAVRTRRALRGRYIVRIDAGQADAVPSARYI